jgi:hypothetical protein
MLRYGEIPSLRILSQTFTICRPPPFCRINSSSIILAATIVVVHIVQAHFADPLFKEPSVVAHAVAIALDRSVGIDNLQLLGDFVDVFEAGRNLGDPGFFKGGLVVIEKRVELLNGMEYRVLSTV